MSRNEPRFSRAFLLVAAIHVLVIGGIIWWFVKPVKKPSGQLTWMETGSFATAEENPSTIAAHPPVTQHDREIIEPVKRPRPTPPKKRTDEAPKPDATPDVPSEIPLSTPTPTPPPTPTPEPTPTPTPKATPSPTPRVTPTPEEKPTPAATPTPKPTPKPSPKASPKPTPKPYPKVTPHASPKVTPKPVPKEESHDASDDKPKKESSEKKSASKPSAGKTSPSAAKAKAESKGEGKGEGKGNSSAKAAFLATKGGGTGAGGTGGNGADPGTVDAYHTLIHDRFYSQWEQPTSIPSEHKHEFAAVLKITISRDGAINSFSLAKPSGNPVMDQSVLEAAKKVLKIAPVPEGMGSSSGYTININFEVE